MQQEPNPCSPSNLLLLILTGVVAALVVALLQTSGPVSFWIDFGITILFVQWVVLVSAAAICSVRYFFPKQRVLSMGWGVVVILPVVSLLASLVFVGFVPLTEPDQTWWFVARNTLISALAAFGFARYLILHSRWKRELVAEAGARLDALQARIRPHFLFNALNTISSLIHDRPDQAEAATLDLADLLRTGISEDGDHTVEAELAVIRRYLRIEALRLGDRLTTQWECADVDDSPHAIPPLLLQPLVENAIVHGISRRAEGGTLRIQGERIRFGRIRFTVTNPLADPDSRPAEGNRSALDNIRQRLALAYEERYGLKTRIEDGQFIAELTIPIES